MRILVDMNLCPAWARFLSDRGFEAKHWSQLGNPAAPGAEILSFAAAGSYVVLTHDLDFEMLLAANAGRGPSVIQVRAQDVMPQAIGDIVVRAIHAAETQLNQGALVTVEPVRRRIRILPI